MFIEESRYPVEDFPEQSGFMQGDYQGTTLTLRWRFWLDAVSGRIVNVAGQSRIVAAYVYVFDFEGMGVYEGSGFRIDNLVPVRRMISLAAADDYAFLLSGLDTPRVDIVDCADIDPADVCALKLCLCENRISNKLTDALDDCDSWGPWAQGIGTGTGTGTLCTVAGITAGGKAGVKRGILGVAIGIVAGACAGYITGEITHQSVERGACRQRARTNYANDMRKAQNEFRACNLLVPPEYTCVVPNP